MLYRICAIGRSREIYEISAVSEADAITAFNAGYAGEPVVSEIEDVEIEYIESAFARHERELDIEAREATDRAAAMQAAGNWPTASDLMNQTGQPGLQ